MSFRVTPPFASLRAFEAVGRCGGIRAAGIALGLSHTVVSRHVRALEEWLGTPLLSRSARQTELTETGQQYHQQVSAALAQLAAASAAVMQGDRTAIRLWCVPGFAAQWLSDQIAKFEHQWPQYTIELRPTDTQADLAMLEADVDIRYYIDSAPSRPGGPGLRTLDLARPPVLAVASPALASELSGLSDPKRLLHAPMLHEEDDRQWRDWLRLNGVEVPAELPGPRMWHAHLALQAARRGQGVALGSHYLVGQDLAAGQLCEIDVTGARPVPLGTYTFVARADLWRIPIIARLRQFLHTAASA